ncbi:hypothetical protein Tco_0712652 [Tanacetum coccineum]
MKGWVDSNARGIAIVQITEVARIEAIKVQQQPNGIFISQDKYVADILKKFDFCSIRTATTPIESNKPLVQDKDGVEPCRLFQVTPKALHLNAVKRIFRYLKHQPKLGLWYPRDSPFELEAFLDSDYGGASLDRKSTTDFKMANLRYSNKHNMIAFLKKPNESVGFTEIVDFLKVRTLANGTPELVVSIDNKEYTITEASVRSKLQLADAAGISNLHDAKIYDGLATLRHVSEGKLTFWKKNFTPQWKFLIHSILHCLSPKSSGWDQFGSPIATALICLSSNRVYNFSKLIFDGMVHNIESNTKFLMYPRFLQMILGITTENNGKYLALTLTKKLFANMKRGYVGDYVPLLPAMLAGAAEDQGEGSAIPAEPQHIPTDPVSSTS